MCVFIWKMYENVGYIVGYIYCSEICKKMAETTFFHFPIAVIILQIIYIYTYTDGGVYNPIETTFVWRLRCLGLTLTKVGRPEFIGRTQNREGTKIHEFLQDQRSKGKDNVKMIIPPSKWKTFVYFQTLPEIRCFLSFNSSGNTFRVGSWWSLESSECLRWMGIMAAIGHSKR